MITAILLVWLAGVLLAWPAMTGLSRIMRFKGHDIGREDLRWTHVTAGLFVSLFWPITLGVRIFSKLFR